MAINGSAMTSNLDSDQSLLRNKELERRITEDYRRQERLAEYHARIIDEENPQTIERLSEIMRLPLP